MDLVFVSGLDYRNYQDVPIQAGQRILQKVVSGSYETTAVSFDYLHQQGIFPYSDDAAESIGRMADYLLSLNPRIIGFYTICSNFHLVLEISQIIREKAPDILLIYGGPHASVTAETILREFPYPDVVCIGESEKSFLPLIDALSGKGSLENVPGIAYRNQGFIQKNAPPVLLSNEELGQFTLFDRDPEERQNSIVLEGGRGCPFSCTFCSTSPFWGRTFRVKPVPVLISEMDRFHQLYSARSFSIEHDIFTASKAHLMEFCSALTAKGSPYRWNCSSRVDVLDDEMISAMAQSGCSSIFLGIETGSERMQKLLKKNLNLNTVVPTVQSLIRSGILVSVSLIYGFPEETLEDFRSTLRLAEQLLILGAREVSLHRYFPLPATEESAKVYDRLYYDAGSVDTSIYAPDSISERGLAFICGYKELFQQFYTFDSEVRSRFAYIQTLLNILSLMCSDHRSSLLALLSRHGIEQTYLRNAALLKDLNRRHSVLSLHGQLADVLISAQLSILEEMEDSVLTELYRFESEVKTFLLGSAESELHAYHIDVEKALQMQEYVPGNTIALFQKAPDHSFHVKTILSAGSGPVPPAP